MRNNRAPLSGWFVDTALRIDFWFMGEGDDSLAALIYTFDFCGSGPTSANKTRTSTRKKSRVETIVTNKNRIPKP